MLPRDDPARRLRLGMRPESINARTSIMANSFSICRLRAASSSLCRQIRLRSVPHQYWVQVPCTVNIAAQTKLTGAYDKPHELTTGKPTCVILCCEGAACRASEPLLPRSPFEGRMAGACVPLDIGGSTVCCALMPPLLRLPLLLLLIVDGDLLTTTGAAAKVTDLPDPGLRGGLGSGDAPRGGVFSGGAAFNGCMSSGIALKLDMSGCADSRRWRRSSSPCA